MRKLFLIGPAALLLGACFALYALPALAQDGDYVGDEVCMACHEDLQAEYDRTVHARVLTPAAGRNQLQKRGCEACHGPGAAHVEAGGGRGNGQVAFRAETPEVTAQENAVCLECHAGGTQLYWKGSPHESSDLACTSCHSVMQNNSDEHQLNKRTQSDTCAQCHLLPRSQMQRNAHHPVREEKMSCGSCHNPHGTISDALMSHATLNEQCYSCHADKRGPFMWEHAPVNEDCATCHVPHGSTRKGMLKSGVPRLCQQCHIGNRHPSEAWDTDSRFIRADACLNCHFQIHGSNHPSGTFFTR